MKILAVDADREALAQLVSSLNSVFKEAEVLAFTKPLDLDKYLLNHKGEVAQIYFPLVIKPFDGLRYTELLRQDSFSGSVVFTTQTDNDEIRELINLNGANRYIHKPVTPAKIQALAEMEQEMCLDRINESGGGNCVDCIYHWCEKRKPSRRVMKMDG